MLRAIALDDEPLPLEILRTFSQRIPDELELLATFSKVMEARAFLATTEVDLIFLDIKMPFLSGVEFYKLFGKGKLLVFTTAFADFALEGFNLHAVDYLLKPFDFERFHQAVDKAEEFHRIRRSKAPIEFIYLKSDSNLVKVDQSSIQYIEAMSDYLKLYIKEVKPLIVRMTMKSILELLGPMFCQIHRSYIVNTSLVESVNSKYVLLGNQRIPIGETYRNETISLFERKGRA